MIILALAFFRELDMNCPQIVRRRAQGDQFNRPGRCDPVLRNATGGVGSVIDMSTSSASEESVSIGSDVGGVEGAANPTECGTFAGGVEMPFTSSLRIVDPATMPVSVSAGIVEADVILAQ